jgi:hypothetical protein
MTTYDLDQIHTPEYLTGFATEFYKSLQEQEIAQNSLQLYFPDRYVEGIDLNTRDLKVTRPVMAFNRAWDAEPSRGTNPPVKIVRFENIPLTQKYTIGEKDQLRARIQSNDIIRQSIENKVMQGVESIADRLEYQRGQTLNKAKFLVETETGGVTEDVWGRSAEADVTAAAKFDAAGTNILNELVKYRQAYHKLNGFYPGAMVMSTRVFMAIQTSTQFATKIGDGYRPATLEDVNGILAGQRLPQITIYDRQVNTYDGPVDVLDSDSIFLLPPAGNRILGETVFSRTVTAVNLGWTGVNGQGIVANIVQRPNVASLRDVVVDSVAMPALYSPDAAFKVKVL